MTTTARREIAEVSIHVTMGEKDACDLLAILDHIGGSPSGPRGAVDQLRDALVQADVRPSSTVRQTPGQPNYFERKGSAQ